MFSDVDMQFMAQALELAQHGRGTTSPNPMVGAVIVRNGAVVGEGFHSVAGGDHAEIIALRNAGDKTRGATLYVTLEPCCHYGKTPPCTDAIIRNGIARVVMAMRDPNPVVCGGGITILENAGIETLVGVLEESARRLNEAYLKFIVSRRPFLTLKMAITLDGKIADVSGNSKWITGQETRKWVHQLRAWSDAVMVGSGTVLADDPELNVRYVKGRNPVRIIIDDSLETPPGARVCSGESCVVATSSIADPAKTEKLESRGVKVMQIETADKALFLTKTMDRLGGMNILSIFCEGGGTLAGSLLENRLVDKVIYTIAPKLLGKGKDSLNGLNIERIENALHLNDVSVEMIENDIVVTGYPVYK